VPRPLKGPRFGVNICEDIWSPGVAERQAQAGALVIVNISCSPYHVGKGEARDGMLSARSSETGAAICYVNLVGGQDELVFDGESVAVGPNGRPIARAPQFEEALLVVDIDTAEIARRRKATGRLGAGTGAAGASRRTEDWAQTAGPQPGRAQVVRIADWGGPAVRGAGRTRAAKQKQAARSRPAGSQIAPRLKPVEEVYRALVLGTRDYVTKNGFKKVAIGLSGGVDSSLVAAIAVDALGADNVRGVLMPSRYTSKKSNDDALALARNLRVKTMTIPIEEAFGAYLNTLRPVFARKKPDITEENIQARIRGNILMALSNKFGWLVLTTGNKSEVAVGYSTLYGDTAGGFAVIKDVPKTLVYRLARFRNSIPPRGVIPGSVLTKAPTAELRPNQKDQDSLPPYATLDPILEAYVERDRSCDEIVARGFTPKVVDRVVSMVDASEYKRRQAPPGVKITPKAFGKDRRMPITNLYKVRKR
jgi:NAD+ synthase (glutamine-hydrolysing)